MNETPDTPDAGEDDNHLEGVSAVFEAGLDARQKGNIDRAVELLKVVLRREPRLAEPRLETVAVNPGIVFGANDVNRNAGKMLLQVTGGGPPSVPRGATTVVNLDDAVAGHLAAMARGRPGERYVLASDAMPFRALYARIAASLGRPAPTRTLPDWVTRA